MKSFRIALSKIAAYFTKLLALTMLAGIVLASPSSAQSQKWDATYVAEDTYFMIGLNVQQLLAYEKKDSKLRQQLTETLQRQSGINVEELEQFQFLMGGEVAEGEDDEDMLQIKLIYKKPQEFDDLLGKIFGPAGHETAKHNGIEYIKSERKRSPAVYIPNDKMIIVANESRLFTLMDSKDSMGDVVDRIKQADGNADLFLTFEHNKMTDRMVGLFAREFDGLPFDIQDIASEAKRGSLTIDLADGKPLIGLIEAKDNDGAERLKRAADALVALGKTGIPVVKEQIEQTARDFGDEEANKEIKEQMKIVQNGLDLAADALEGTTVETEGNHVEIKVAVMGGFVDGARSLVLGLFGVRSVRPVEGVRIDDVEIRGLEKDDRPNDK